MCENAPRAEGAPGRAAPIRRDCADPPGAEGTFGPPGGPKGPAGPICGNARAEGTKGPPGRAAPICRDCVSAPTPAPDAAPTCEATQIRVTIRPVEPGPCGPAAPSCPHALEARIAERPPLSAPASPHPPAPKITREDDSEGLTVLATSQILVPLAKRAYSRDELRLLDLFGVELQEFSTGPGGVWSAPVRFLAPALAAVTAYRQGRGADPATIAQKVGVTSLRVPHAQKEIDDDLGALYEALSLETINLVFENGGAAPAVVTTVLDHVERVRGRGSLAVQDKKWHTLPLAAIGLRAYYAGPPAPIIRALASFCGVPYCTMLNRAGLPFWVAALDGPSILASARALGALH